MSLLCRWFGWFCPKPKPTLLSPPTPVSFSTYVNVEPTSGVAATLIADDGSRFVGQGQQHINFLGIPTRIQGSGASLVLTAKGFQDVSVRVSLQTPLQSDVKMVPLFPAPPTRDQRGLPTLHFGGVMWNHSQFGEMPLFEVCIPWLSKEDRFNLYSAKHAVGDTHLLVGVPNGKPLYDEPNQPYSADRFGALAYDAAHLVEVVTEAIQEGFIPVVFMDELHDESLRMITQVITDLHDLVPYCIFSPGFDGVFYGWEPSHVLIPEWAAAARAAYSGDQHDLMLFLEFNPGHIPLGEGDGDYKAGGNMSGFDIVAGEFSPWLYYGRPAGDEVWQIVSRMGCPNGYNRPADQPAGDDPHPPYVLHDSERGRRYGWVFETGMYEFNLHPDRMGPLFDAQRQAFRDMGCEVVC